MRSRPIEDVIREVKGTKTLKSMSKKRRELTPEGSTSDDPDRLVLPTPKLLHVGQRLFNHVRDHKGLDNWSSYYSCFLRADQVLRFAGNAISRDKYRDLREALEEDTLMLATDSNAINPHLPVLEISCATTDVKLEEGNHRVQVMYDLGYTWVPVAVRITDYSSKYMKPPNRSIPKSLSTHPNMCKDDWTKHVPLVLQEVYGLDILDLTRPQPMDSFRSLNKNGGNRRARYFRSKKRLTKKTKRKSRHTKGKGKKRSKR
jgi:hypothetical protein